MASAMGSLVTRFCYIKQTAPQTSKNKNSADLPQEFCVRAFVFTKDTGLQQEGSAVSYSSLTEAQKDAQDSGLGQCIEQGNKVMTIVHDGEKFQIVALSRKVRHHYAVMGNGDSKLSFEKVRKSAKDLCSRKNYVFVEPKIVN